MPKVFTLDTIRPVAQQLNLLPVAVPAIVVGGTNGKGSCVAVCEAILRAAGYKTGSYYSPHLIHFNERIRVNNQPVIDATILQAFYVIELARADIELSYFEFATLAALWIFQQQAVDVIVLEVGVGGRLDSVNIVDANVSVITSIDLDHTQWLGETRAAIALEKAGIYRRGKPAICGDIDPPSVLMTYVKQLRAIGHYRNQTYHVTEQTESWTWQTDTLCYADLPKPTVSLNNAATALVALTALALPISLTAIQQGLRTVVLAGRWQVLTQPILQIFDVAHNPAAGQNLATRLQQEQVSHQGQTHALVGMCQDKAIAQTLQPLIPLVDHWYCASLVQSRGASADYLAAVLAGQGVTRVQTFMTPLAAYYKALTKAKPKDCLLIFGSFYTVGEILATLDVNQVL